MRHVPVVESNGSVVVKLSPKYVTIAAPDYHAWRLANRSRFRTIACASFTLGCDAVFESLVSIEFRLGNLWRTDLLSHWHWVTHKTGITTVHERLDALEAAAAKFLASSPSNDAPAADVGRPVRPLRH